jgi:hypothetical protein
MAGYAELTIEQGTDFNTIINVNDGTGAAQILTSYTAAAQMRKSYYSTTANSFTVTISNAANGEITMVMTSANTANLTPGRYFYDLVMTSPTNIKTRVVEGIATILPSVTR